MNLKIIRILITSIISLVGGIAFLFIHMPIPWLLGPMVAVFIASRLIKTPNYRPLWLPQFRNTAMTIIGYSIGLSFTHTALVQIGYQLPSMIVLTCLLMLLCIFIAFLASRVTRMDLPTMITGCIPGGLSQMITVAEDMKGINLTVVTFLQVTRMMMIVLIVPLLVFSPLFGGEHSVVSPVADVIDTAATQAVPWFPNILVFAVVIAGCIWLGKKIKLPALFMVAPMLGTAVLLQLGLQGPTLSSLILNVAQFLIGTYIGLLLKPEQLTSKSRIIATAIVSNLLLIVGSIGLSRLLTYVYDLSPMTSFLSMAPGGMDQMSIVAHAVGADLSVVSSYQLFRVFFIYFLVPPMLRILFAFMTRSRSRVR